MAEAKKIAEQEKIDLYILGLELQDCSGFDICRYIRDQDYGRSVPIIFMSSTDTMDNREAGENAGGSDFITKNVLSEKIRELINRWLNPDKTLVGMRALVIDDQLTSRLVISNFLEHEGVEVVGCPSGEKGLESLREAGGNFDMIITEVDASNTRSSGAHRSVGFEVLKTYRANDHEWELIGLRI